jgi:hypothetical protein
MAPERHEGLREKTKHIKRCGRMNAEESSKNSKTQKVKNDDDDYWKMDAALLAG